MPNHCENALYMWGNDEDVSAVLSYIGADQNPPKFDFNAVIPEDDESNWYHWRCEHWGTMWNSYDVVWRDYRHACISFRTAWTPPTPVIAALAKRFPRVSFALEYLERGMNFAGGFTCPARKDYCGNEPWEPGIKVDEWHTKEYRGHRGG